MVGENCSLNSLPAAKLGEVIHSPDSDAPP